MTARPSLPDSRRWPSVAVALVLVVVAVMAAGCVTQTASYNQTGTISSPVTIVQTQKARPTPTPDFSTGSMASDTSGSVSVANNITELLVYWNENFHWNLSPAQIDEYALRMENGVLKKYMTNPDYPHALFIPDERQFDREVGGALGFTQSESEDFVRALDDLAWQKFATCPSWETCGTPQPIVLNFSVKPRPLITTP